MAIMMGTAAAAAAASSSSRRAVAVAVAQLRSTRNKHSNLLNVAKCAGWAKRDGAQMLFLPECLGFMGDSAEHTLKQADPSMEELLLLEKNNNNNEHDPLALTTSTGTGSMIAPFRRALADAIESHAARPGFDSDEDDINEFYNDSNSNNNNSDDDDDGEETTVTSLSIIEELCFIARESKLWISGGGIHTVVPPSDKNENENENENENKIYNTHVIIDNHGKIKAHYHKIHLFDVSIPNKVELRESNTTRPGNQLVVCDSPVGRLGLTICYDMRFGEMYVDLVQKMGAEVLLMPSAFTVPTGKAHWHALLKARAIESQCYVLAAAQVGQHNEKRQSYGHSVVYDPWGELLADAGGYDGTGTVDATIESQNKDEDSHSPVRVPSIVMSEIDLDKLGSVRERMPIQQHRDNSAFS